MIIEIPRLPQDGDRFVGEEPVSILAFENESHIRANDPIKYDLFAQVVSHGLVVKGSVEVLLECECSRCAGFFSTIIGDSSFLRAYELPAGTEQMDVTGDIREAILLQLPHFPLCSDGCKGLCPVCGKNLNEGQCECRPESPGGALGDLDKLEL